MQQFKQIRQLHMTALKNLYAILSTQQMEKYMFRMIHILILNMHVRSEKTNSILIKVLISAYTYD